MRATFTTFTGFFPKPAALAAFFQTVEVYLS